MTTLISTPENTNSRNWSSYQLVINQSRIWFFILIALGTMSNIVYTCTVPLVGFGAVAGTTLTRRRGMSVIFSMWFVNQVLGFTVRQYPWTPSTFAWGGVMLLGGILATVLTSFFPRYKTKGFLGYLCQVFLSLVGGYIVYELIIWLAGFVLGGVSGFTLPILWQIFAGNALWAMILTGIYGLLIWRVIRFRK